MLLIPVALVTTLAPSAGCSLAAYATYAFLSAALLASIPVPIQLGLPNMMVGRGITVFSFVTSAIAGSAGPLFVELLTDCTHISLGAALAITGGAQ